MDSVRIEIAPDLVSLVRSPDPNTNVLKLIGQLRKQLASEQLVEVPKVHVMDNQRLPAASYSIFIREQPVSSGSIPDTADLTAFSAHLRRTLLEHKDALSAAS